SGCAQGSPAAEPTPSQAQASEAPAAQLYTPGTYTATAQGNNGPLTLSVTFDAEAITGITIEEHTETAGISDAPIASIPAAIVEGQTLAVDTVAGATYTSNAILKAVEDCVIQAGGDVTALKAAGEKTEVEKTAVTREAEVLVAGGGIAGLTAAVTAADQGAKVLLVEKMPAVGGTTITAGAYFLCVNSSLQNPKKIDDSIDGMMAYWHKVMDTGPDTGYPDYDRVRNVLSDSGKTVDYLVSVGVPFLPEISDPFGGTAVANVDGRGPALIASLEAAAKAKGVEILVNCKAESLITDASGAVTGIKASTATEDLTINAKSIVLATGGFGSNPEMVKEYSPEIVPVVPQSAAGSTGDGILMAEAIGAARFKNYWTAFSGAIPGGEYTRAVPEAAKLSPSAQLMVNGKGERFINEFASLRAELPYQLVKDANYPHYVLFDSSNAELVPTLEAGIALGEVFKGDTIEALASAINVDQATLKATYERYNTLAKGGKDEDFGKSAELMTVLETGPLYAVKFYPATFGSTGGVVTDVATGNVLREDGTGIANLYAAGEMSNRDFYNQHYVLAASLAFYSTMGMRAGTAAAANVK
ncbi:MAG TPA: FAD-dependent oxidoreductase, partial [Feifaniaceae bacterium]|nr:FAD-dependent oxidoreductase [Feifaniaceae bacterium]